MLFTRHPKELQQLGFELGLAGASALDEGEVVNSAGSLRIFQLHSPSALMPQKFNELGIIAYFTLMLLAKTGRKKSSLLLQLAAAVAAFFGHLAPEDFFGEEWQHLHLC